MDIQCTREPEYGRLLSDQIKLLFSQKRQLLNRRLAGRMGSGYLFQQNSGFLQILSVKTFGEPFEYRGE